MDVQSFHFRGGEIDNINFAKVLMLLSQNREEAGNTFRKRVFECKTCNRQFSSFQALGGHRASHKKPRLPEDSQGSNAEALKPKVHGCSICGLEFAIGQALGGHMRRHRTSGPRRFGHRIVEKNANGKRVLFDLNSVPEGEGEEDIIECREVMEVELGVGVGLGLGHGAVEKRPMVDCVH